MCRQWRGVRERKNEHNGGIHVGLHKWAQSCLLIILVYSRVVTGRETSRSRLRKTSASKKQSKRHDEKATDRASVFAHQNSPTAVRDTSVVVMKLSATLKRSKELSEIAR